MTADLAIPLQEVKYIFREKRIPTLLFTYKGESPNHIRTTFRFDPLESQPVQAYYVKKEPTFWDRILKRNRYELEAVTVPGWGNILSNNYTAMTINEIEWDINIDHLQFKYCSCIPVWGLPPYLLLKDT